MRIKQKIAILVVLVFMAPAAYAVETVTFENYLKAFDYQERKDGLLGLADYLRGDRAKDFIREEQKNER